MSIEIDDDCPFGEPLSQSALHSLIAVECESTEIKQIDYDINERREEFMERMYAKGYMLVLPKFNELQIDIDDNAQFAVFEKSIESLRRNWWYEDPFIVEMHDSKSGYPSRHITITLPFDVEPWQRIALQASLGSDPMRELLSSVRMLNGDTSPTLFIEVPAQGVPK